MGTLGDDEAGACPGRAVALPVDGRRSSASLLRYYDACLEAHGDTAQGAGWPNEPDRLTRFAVALDIVDALVPVGAVTLCDLGCGSGELLRSIRARGRPDFDYRGVDLSARALALARTKFPGAVFHRLDVLTASPEEMDLLSCDVLVANGLFTVRDRLSEAEMWGFMTTTLRRVWPLVRRGIVFNVMSPIVDWRREDLFHVSYDALAAFLHGLAGRRIGFRADYGLYEYMAYAGR